jgi:glycosyltransferase involved in cell wall biosynthesis
MLQVTDRLLGSSPEEAAHVVGAVSRRATVALALHDVPQPAEGGSWYRRRRDAYADMTDAADVVVVASEHERDCLERCRREAGLVPPRAGQVVVVPLPIDHGPDRPPPRDVQETEVAVLGFLYPGKGVEEVVAAAARLRRAGRNVRVTCLGAPAEGHAEHASDLIAGAALAGVPLRVTGFVPEDQLRSRLRTVGVPVAPHRHISASGSINAWLEAGRRPITLPSPYARELADRVPRALDLVEDVETGIIDALDQPERTWLGPEVVLGPSTSEVARWHADVLDELVQHTPRMASRATVFA